MWTLNFGGYQVVMVFGIIDIGSPPKKKKEKWGISMGPDSLEFYENSIK